MEDNSLLMMIATGIGGLVIGFIIGWMSRSSGDGEKLAEDLKKTQQELEQYRREVGGHFAQTAELVGKMTAQYRAVYEHLAEGAHRLGGDEANRLEAAIIQGESLLAGPADKKSGDAPAAKKASGQGDAGAAKAAVKEKPKADGGQAKSTAAQGGASQAAPSSPKQAAASADKKTARPEKTKETA